ncbi:hypothetical protein TSAR_001599 [Trichomalopsis sarcophagae]|uniref:Uncharacterized protein n=1 Tax=Trichomalopsis sarcophagae TaxID=543379 RepID=A0A232F0S8_9HYME|nr:hypothetical protein TSAR_001599 [Trichomalopsis sarcophagae]
MSDTVLPETLIQKIFFTCFAFIAMKFSADFYFHILQIRYINEMISLDTFEDISKSGYSIYVNPKIKDYVFDYHPDSHVVDMKNKTETFVSISDCLKQIRKRFNVICITNEVDIERVSKTGMRVAKPVFRCIKWIFLMENRSLFVHKLQKIFNRLREAGANKYFEPPKIVTDYSVAESEEDVFLQTTVLATVLVIGYFISTIAMFIELLIAYVNYKANRVTVLAALKKERMTETK